MTQQHQIAKKKVTISVACYNVESFIPKNIDCILNQTYRNIEIILVNDGSTDSSGELCNKIASADNRVKVIHKDNGGLGSARNAALDAATGEYIYFVDIDDRIDFDLIERILKIAQTNNTDIVIFGLDIHDVNNGTVDKNRFPDKVIINNEELKNIFVDEVYFKKHGNGFVCNKFYNRNFIENNGFRFGSERIQQDEPFNLRLYQKSQRVALTSQSGYHYYLDMTSSAGAKYVDRKLEAVSSVFESLRNFYDEWQLHDKRFLDAAYRRYRGALLNVVCYNYFHKNCPLTSNERLERIKVICSSQNFRECYDYLSNDNSLNRISAFFWYCMKKRHVKLLVMVNGLIIKIKKIVKR